MKFEEQICSSILRAVKELYGQEVPVEQVQLQKTKSTFEGHLTLVVFPFVSFRRRNQRILHKKLVTLWHNIVAIWLVVSMW